MVTGGKMMFLRRRRIINFFSVLLVVVLFIGIIRTFGRTGILCDGTRGPEGEQRHEHYVARENGSPDSQEEGNNPTETHLEMVKKRFQLRKDMLHRACRMYGNSSLFRPVEPVGNMHPLPLYRPVMNVSIRYCGIAKTASTTWGGFFATIKSYMTSRGIKPSMDQTPSKARQVNFSFVREPYSRLWSAYVDKLLTPNELFWRSTGSYIATNFRRGAPKKACGHDVTFSEFVKYVIYAQKTPGLLRDGHFIPIHDQCQFCKIPYNFIGHLQTIADDMPFITAAIQSPIFYNRTYDTDTIKQNARMVFLKSRKARVERCMDLDEASRRLWKKYQIRGLISKREPFPYKPHTAVNITLEEFVSSAVKAYERCKHCADRKAQRSDSLREAFAHISLEDRLQLQQIFFLDFQMFGFDPYLEEVFPLQPYVKDGDFSYLNIY